MEERKEGVYTTRRWKRFLTVPFLFTLLLIGSGCGRRLMRTPLVYGPGGVDPFAKVSLERQTSHCDLFLVTDRARSTVPWAKIPYTNDRSPELNVARARVQIGDPQDSWTEVREGSLSSVGNRRPRVELAEIDPMGPLWTTVPTLRSMEADSTEMTPVVDRFCREIDKRLEGRPEKVVCLFVHGYKTGLEEAVELSAELHHFLGRRGVFISYSWPSRDNLKGYFVDKLISAYSARNFRFLINLLAMRTKAEKIHIVSHSAGTSVVVLGLRDLRLLNDELSREELARRFRIGQVILAAPDMDLMIFGQSVRDGWTDIPTVTTIYASREDRALGLSERLFKMTRVGNPFEALTFDQLRRLRGRTDAYLVDVSRAQKEYREWLGHGYFYKNPWVSSDLMLVLRTDAPPPDRELIPQEGGAIWSFPDDYPQRVGRIAVGNNSN